MAQLWLYISTEDRAMRFLRVSFAILAAIFIFNSPCQAASSAVMQVSATIRPWVIFNAVQHFYSYKVTSVDLQRGYVDLVGSITLDIKTNIRKEISVKFNSGNGERVLFKESAGGSFFENEYTLHPDSQRPGENISRKIDSRIMLANNSKEGVYALSVSMSPEI